MNETSTVNERNELSTADLVQASRAPQPREEEAAQGQQREQESLTALFEPDAAQRFRTHWDDIQIGFVDDPRKAVRQADELVAQVMTDLAQTFSRERSQLERLMDGGAEESSTENLRVALRRYRSFFQRLLSL